MNQTIYLFANGLLRRKDNTICFESNEGVRKYVPIETVKEMHIFGKITINSDLLSFLTQKQILLHFYNFFDYYQGTYYPREHYNSGYMTIKQALFYQDESSRLFLAKQFVKGAYRNMRKVILYYHNRGHAVKQIGEYIKYLADTIDEQSDINSLMAIEGNIREKYYTVFDTVLDDSDFAFQKRSRRPPKNPINALISFGNMLLYTSVLSEVYKTHLDPRIGYLHTSNFRRFSLNLDVAEIFKPILVDRLIFSLINKGIIKKKDFSKELPGFYLKEESRKIFVEKWEERLQTTVKCYKIQHKVSYRRLLRLELYKLEKHFLGEKEYESYKSEW
jgi:CRISP-associated protein Cas1